jgi:uncharacterized iron-regulated protein
MHIMLLSLLALVFAGFSPASTSNSAPAFAVVADTIEVTSEHYRIYRSDGTPATIADVQAALAKIDVVFVGEQHDDPVSHFVEREVLKDMYNIYGQATALSMEMFSRDVQYIVDEYLAGLITDAHFQQSSSPWSNYVTDYKPQVDFAKENGLDVIAANAPRRYANRVTRLGRQSLMDLSDQALSYVAPLPYGGASEKYTAQWNKVMAEAMASMGAAPKKEEAEMKHEMAEGEHKMAEHKMEMKHEAPAAAPAPSSGEHGGDTMLDAQSLWDATMAWSIAEHLTRKPGSKVVHMVGGFHSETGTGTPEHLIQYRPGTRFMVITMKTTDDINTFDPEEHAGMGDFVILGDASLPRTYGTRTR